jgi:signal transduction histidine kinase
MRLRIAAGVAALTLLAILAQAVAMLMIFDEKEEDFIEGILGQQIAHSMAVWHTAPESAFPNTPDMQLYRIANDTPPAAKIPVKVSALPVGNHEIIRDGREFHVAVRADDSARYILLYDVEDHEARLRDLMLITASAGVLLALIVLLAGYALAGGLASRLERLAARVGEPGSTSLVEAGMERELLAIADALDRYRQRQQEALAREQAFAANLSHELRTPLTAIRTDAEMLAALPDAPASVTRRANRMIGSVDRINALGNSLLLLGREARPALLEEIRLRSAITAVWESLTIANSKPVSLRLEVAEGTAVTADPALFDLVLRNLLDNALRYSEEGEIVCALEGSRLVVTDCGPGFGEANLTHVFDRFYTGPRGRHGLGLALVQHVCTASGWQVSADNAATGGARVVVELGASLHRF